MPRRIENGIDRGVDEFLIHGDFEFHLRDQVGYHHQPAVDFGIFLPAVAVHTNDRDARDSRSDERFAHFVELVFLYNGCNQFHDFFLFKI